VVLWPFILFAATAGTENITATAQPLVTPDRGWHGDLSLMEEYRVRTGQPGSASTAGALGEPVAANPRTDQDVRLLLDGQGQGLRDHLLGQISSALWLDLDGHRPSGQPDLFGETSDFRQPLVVLYALSAEWRRSSPLEYLRLGRQTSQHGLPVTFDGGSLGLRLWERKLSLFGYGGRTVHFFETQPGLLEYWVVCAGGGYRPSENVRFEIDSRFERDGMLARDTQQTVFVYAHSYGATLSLRFAESWAKLYARGLNRSASHVGGAMHLASTELAAGLDVQANAQLRVLGELSENEHPFYSLLGPSQPHLRARLEGWKGLAIGAMTVVDLRVGWRVRQLLRGEEGPFNRNSGGIYAQAEVDNLAAKGLFLSGVVEWIYIPWYLRDDAYVAVGGSAGYAAHRVRVEAGTYFQQWKVNYYRDVEELQHARTAFALASVRPAPWLELRARYVLELADRALHSAFISLREDL
jgi:hypothetical protein